MILKVRNKSLLKSYDFTSIVTQALKKHLEKNSWSMKNMFLHPHALIAQIPNWILLRLPKIFCTFNTWEFSKHLFHVSTNVSTYQDHTPNPALLAAGPRQGWGSAQTQPSSHAPPKQKVLSRNPGQLFRHTDLFPCKMFKEQQRLTNQILETPLNALDVT